MATQLVYDPTTKRMIKDQLFDFIYAPVNKDFDQRLKAIIVKNSSLHFNDQTWVSYRGQYYTFDESSRRSRPVNRLKPDLQVIMDEYLEDLKRVNDKEQHYVANFLNQVLNSSNSLQDYFRLLPTSMHKPLKELMMKCACREEQLNDEAVEDIKRQNSVPLELMKKRMVLNLLI